MAGLQEIVNGSKGVLLSHVEHCISYEDGKTRIDWGSFVELERFSFFSRLPYSRRRLMLKSVKKRDGRKLTKKEINYLSNLNFDTIIRRAAKAGILTSQKKGNYEVCSKINVVNGIGYMNRGPQHLYFTDRRDAESYKFLKYGRNRDVYVRQAKPL